MNLAVGVDIGGTNIKAVLAGENGKIIKKFKAKTGAGMKKKRALENVLKAVGEVLPENKKVKGIGVGFAGVVDGKGKILFAPHLKPLKGTNLKSFLEKNLHKKVFVENDANLMTWGESVWGKAKKFRLVLGVTLGTGLGGGIVLDRKILPGGEFGHLCVFFGGKKCGCGNRGCWEEYVSRKAFLETAKSKMRKQKSSLSNYPDLIPKDIDREAKKGDMAAKETIEELSGYLAVGLGNLVNIFSPDAIVLGGGLSNSRLLLNKAKKRLDLHIVKAFRSKTKIIKASYGDYSVAAGAAAYALGE